MNDTTSTTPTADVLAGRVDPAIFATGDPVLITGAFLESKLKNALSDADRVARILAAKQLVKDIPHDLRQVVLDEFEQRRHLSAVMEANHGHHSSVPTPNPNIAMTAATEAYVKAMEELYGLKATPVNDPLQEVIH